MKFYWAVIIKKDWVGTGDWDDFAYDDYAVHCLLNEKGDIIFLNDNMHTIGIELAFSSFVDGVSYALSEEITPKKILLAVNDDLYADGAVKEAFAEWRKENELVGDETIKDFLKKVLE